MHHETRPRIRFAATPRSAALIVAVVLVLTAGAGVLAWRNHREQNVLRETSTAERAAATLETELLQAIAPVQGAQAILDDGQLSLPRFRAYSGPILTTPGVTAVGLIVPVPGDQRDAFEEQWGFPVVDRQGGDVVAAPPRDMHYPAVAVSPEGSPTLRTVLGFDFAGEPVRAEAIRVATESGTTVVTDVLPLASSNQLGFLVVQPLVSGDRAVGFVAVGLAVDTLVQLVSRQMPDGVLWEVGQGERVVGTSAPAPRQAGYRISLEVAGRDWWVRVDDRRAQAPVLAITLFTAGGSLSLLLALMFIQTFRAQRSLLASRASLARAEQMASDLQRFTARLSRSLTVSEVAATVMTSGMELTEARAAAVLVLGEDPASPELLMATGIHPEEVDVGPSSPIGRAARTGRLVWASTQGPAGEGAFDEVTAVGLPLRSGDALRSGSVEFRFEPPRRFSPAERVQLAAISDQSSQAMQRARLYEMERALAEELQHALLPASLPRVEGVELAGRYLPAATGVAVGGDWYDALELPDGRIALILGDVVGRGPAAAAVMGQLRSAAHLLALRGEPPERALPALDRFAMSVEGANGTTLVYAVYDPVGGSVSYCRGGHPPPLVVDPDGRTRFLEDGSCPPIGFGFLGSPAPRGVSRLAPGATLLLYTDGAVERRGEEIREGMERLAEAAAGAAGAGPEGMCSAVVGAAVEAVTSFDDLAILALRRQG